MSYATRERRGDPLATEWNQMPLETKIKKVGDHEKVGWHLRIEGFCDLNISIDERGPAIVVRENTLDKVALWNVEAKFRMISNNAWIPEEPNISFKSPNKMPLSTLESLEVGRILYTLPGQLNAAFGKFIAQDEVQEELVKVFRRKEFRIRQMK